MTIVYESTELSPILLAALVYKKVLSWRFTVSSVPSTKVQLIVSVGVDKLCAEPAIALLLTVTLADIFMPLVFTISMSHTPVMVSSKSSKGLAVKEFTTTFSLVLIVRVLEMFPSLSAHTNVIIYM